VITEQADTDGSGEIELGEWIAFCKTNFKLQLGDKALKAIFDDIDADHSGAVSLNELSSALTDALKLAEAELVKEAMKGVDTADVRRDTKLIALVAHNNMKPTMMTFVAENRDFFKQVRIVTTGSTGASLEQKLGLVIDRKVASGPLGGDQEIGGMITNDEVAGVFFFIDPLTAWCHNNDIGALCRICQVHDVPTAETPSTGTALVHAFRTYEPFKKSLFMDYSRGESSVVSDYKAQQKAVIAKTAATSSDGGAKKRARK